MTSYIQQNDYEERYQCKRSNENLEEPIRPPMKGMTLRSLAQ